jgi:hypothetical protein
MKTIFLFLNLSFGDIYQVGIFSLDDRLYSHTIFYPSQSFDIFSEDS